MGIDDISQDPKVLSNQIYKLAKMWEMFIQEELERFVITNTHLKYFNDYSDQKIIPQSNGSVLIKKIINL